MTPRFHPLFLLLRRILGTAKGRPFAGLMLTALLLLNIMTELPSDRGAPPTPVARVFDFLGVPFSGARTFLFDGFQRLLPRKPKTQPVTAVAIDEKSLDALGQWPWPRDQLAALIDAINRRKPAAIGLDLYMPEPDQTSPDKVAARLPAEQKNLAQALRALPSHETLLVRALREAPTVLGAAGFDFHTYTTSSGMRSVPLAIHGEDPLPLVRHFPQVLASLPELQAAAHGQALLSVDVQSGGVRQVPLLAAVGNQLIPGLSMEMLRVATGSTAVEVTTQAGRIQSVQVADLVVPTQERGDIWLHFAPLASGAGRYVSASDVLQGRVDPAMFEGKLVLLGLTGLGLNDMRTTALGELVPGIEIQAQVIESLFDGRFLLRPWWMKWLETLVLGLIGASLIWFVPRTDSRLASILKNLPWVSVWITLMIDFLLLVLGFILFAHLGLLLDAAAFVIVFSLVMATLISSALIEGLGEARTKLTHLVDNGIMLGREQDRDNLLRKTLLSAKAMANCQAATLYLKTEHDTLCFAMRTRDEALPVAELPLYDAEGRENHRLVATHVVLSGETLIIDDLAKETRFDFRGALQFGKASGLELVSAMNVPMKPGDGKVIGLIQLMNAMDAQSGEVIAFSPKLVGFMEALAAQAAVAIENRNLLEAQKNLIDAIIRIIAGAIDAKSAYTGGHCERVPELAIMLAEKACQVNEGPLASFAFKTEDEWREFRIGAWLHDAGKVTTPEYVVDKATKLETIFNRIHEIRTRFEVLLRDAHIERLKAVHERGEDKAMADARFESTKAELIDDFAFVAACNQGGEFLAPSAVERLQRIARHTWLRHFDDRLGLSHEELGRHEKSPAPALPVTEQLLMDKPHHLIERPPNKALDEKYGFKLAVPKYLYNYGEVYNLGVSRGTLTEEERFKINEHIIQTIVMLEQMPLPSTLKRIPEYAGTHHETLDGKGYPRQLGADDLSIPSRIMAIADIFEALTASDRPYKKAKTLSESIHILSRFKREKHIDPVLFDLFLTSGTYKAYAERYLRPEQIDEVDISQYVESLH